MLQIRHVLRVTAVTYNIKAAITLNQLAPTHNFRVFEFVTKLL